MLCSCRMRRERLIRPTKPANSIDCRGNVGLISITSGCCVAHQPLIHRSMVRACFQARADLMPAFALPKVRYIVVSIQDRPHSATTIGGGSVPLLLSLLSSPLPSQQPSIIMNSLCNCHYSLPVVWHSPGKFADKRLKTRFIASQ